MACQEWFLFSRGEAISPLFCYEKLEHRGTIFVCSAFGAYGKLRHGKGGAV